jgi:hypothetical protein
VAATRLRGVVLAGVYPCSSGAFETQPLATDSNKEGGVRKAGWFQTFGLVTNYCMCVARLVTRASLYVSLIPTRDFVEIPGHHLMFPPKHGQGCEILADRSGSILYADKSATTSLWISLVSDLPSERHLSASQLSYRSRPPRHYIEELS